MSTADAVDLMNSWLWEHFDYHNDGTHTDDDDDDDDGAQAPAGPFTFDPCGPLFESNTAAAIVQGVVVQRRCGRVARALRAPAARAAIVFNLLTNQERSLQR